MGGRRSQVPLTFPLRLVAACALGGLIWSYVRAVHNPDIPFLFDSPAAVWVTADNEVDLGACFEPQTTWQFRRRFALDAPQPASTLQLQALRRVFVRLDDQQLFQSSEDLSQWKQVHPVPLPELDAGEHLFLVEVTNQNGPAALWIDSRPLLATSRHWEVSTDNGESWQPARPASAGKWADLSGKFPTVPQAFRQTAPGLLLVFVATFAFTWRRTDPLRSPASAVDPARLRTALVFATGLLALHNIGSLPPHVGYDLFGHLEYIQFVVEQGRIPLASDGWQTFQSPLYYLLSAPLYWLLADQMEPESLVRLLRVVPLACGLIQIEIVYRAARIAFPQQPGKQCVATTVGGMMPMSVSMSQAIGNEPLAGMLTALTLLQFLKLLNTDRSSTRDFATLGIVWGLALLTKVTPLLLGPVLVLGGLLRSLQSGDSRRTAVGRVGILLASAFVVCGWYYVRNQILLDRPFVGGWDPSRGIVWWQYPGYRMPDQLTRFGAALIQPIYSGVHGLWDGLYSTIYADGFLSGILAFPYRPPWNAPYLIAGAWWGLVPTLLILLGTVRGLILPGRGDPAERYAIVVAAVLLVTYLAAVIHLYLRIPIYGAAKGSYLLGLLPCLGLLAAAGAAPLLRSRTGTATLAGLLACWCVGTLMAFSV